MRDLIKTNSSGDKTIAYARVSSNDPKEDLKKQELMFSLCEHFGVEVVIINRSEDSTYEEDLAKDIMDIITVFSARMYGSRSHRNKKIVEKLREIANNEL